MDNSAPRRLAALLLVALACPSCQSPQAPAVSWSDGGRVVTYAGVPGETALATLRTLAEVKTARGTLGEFVLAINGLEVGGSSGFWAFYVNGKFATVGAGSYVAREGDVIEWRLAPVR